jgi:predicted HD phosphohydrolase
MSPKVTRLDTATKEQRLDAVEEHKNSNVPTDPDGLLALLRVSAGYPAFSVDSLTQMLQTAARAERAGASDELVLAALMHDIGTPVALHNHAAAAAALVAPYVSHETYEIVRTRQDFQGRYYYQHFGGRTYERYAKESWFDTAVVFSDEWDQCSFDPRYPNPALAHFEPLVRDLCAAPRDKAPRPASATVDSGSPAGV